ncbi:MAG: hypothetical protein H7Y60_12895 [Rhodospirillaceae bacterium]|nr:hypothetical protein [Rhodospirillales bacterium]
MDRQKAGAFPPKVVSVPKLHYPAPEQKRPAFVPNGWLLFFDAIDRLGRGLYGEAWTGAEVQARDLPPWSGKEAKLDVLLGEGAAQRLRENHEAEYAARQRRNKAALQLRQHLFEGRLTACHFTEGGETVIPASKWGPANEPFFVFACQFGCTNTSLGRPEIFVKEVGLDFGSSEAKAVVSADVVHVADEAAGKVYSTKLLSVVDALRAKIAADPSPANWTRDSIMAESRGLRPELSDRDAGAIATVLLPDAKRGK